MIERCLPCFFVLLCACVETTPDNAVIKDAPVACSVSWYEETEKAIGSGDGQGHGPDIGSEEWKSVIEFKLGVRGSPAVPPRDSDAWCQYVDDLLQERLRRTDDASFAPAASADLGPSFSCAAVDAGSIPAMVCADAELSALDRQLADVYQRAQDKATNEHPPTLAAMQRGWIKGRDDCWKSDDKRTCVATEYRRRIASLQARYRLIPFEGPVFYYCDGNPGHEVVVTYFDTDPPALIAERADNVSLMFQEVSASGTRYVGRNESFWEHQGEARLQWGFEAPVVVCEQKS